MAEQSGPDLKYPRTPHFPFSPGRTDDDVVLEEVANIPSFPLLSKEVVVTEKLDGGNCCISRGKVYARTLNSEATHPSFGPIKRLASQFTSFKEYEDLILPLMKNRSKCGSCTPEGFVVRTLEGFSYERFDSHVAKFVRRGHIQTDETWRRTWRAAKLK
jgi:hypothetical protein